MDKRPLVVVSSYTRFDNLAHGPTGTEAKHSMWTYRLNTSNGQMTLVSVNAHESNSSKAVMNPAFSRVHPFKNILYACTESVEENGQIITWEVNPLSGKIKQLGAADAHGTSTCYITLDRKQRHALVVNYWNATIVVLPIDRVTGIVGDNATDIYDPNYGRQMAVKAGSHVNHSINNSSAQKERQLDPHSHAVILDPFHGKIAYVPDLGMDLIRQVIYNDEAGTLTAAGHINSGEKGKVALGPRYIEFHPTFPIAYVVNELSSEVAIFYFDNDAAKRVILSAETCGDKLKVEQSLVHVQTVSTIPDGFPQDMNTCGRLHVHNSGRFVIVSNRGHDSVCVFSVDQETGLLLTPVLQHTRGATPRHFQFDGSGQWMIVANQDSDTIGVFRFNLSTGDITWTGNQYSVPSPNFVCCCDSVTPIRINDLNSLTKNVGKTGVVANSLPYVRQHVTKGGASKL
jgi:6-phosphogluconolactonase